MSLSLSHTQMCISRYLFKQIGNKICFCDNEDNHSDQDVDEYHDDGDEYHMMKFSCNLRAGPNDSGDAEAAKSKGFSTFFSCRIPSCTRENFKPWFYCTLVALLCRLL